MPLAQKKKKAGLAPWPTQIRGKTRLSAGSLEEGMQASCPAPQQPSEASACHLAV